MTPELKVELRRLRKVRFYYLSSKIPEGVWRDGDGIKHDMWQMELSHLQACIRLITKDVANLKSMPNVSQPAMEKLTAQARIKRQELRAVFKRKSIE